MYFYFVLISTLIVQVFSNSDGAPQKVCNNGLVPEHGVDPQTSSPPYKLSGTSSLKSELLLELSLDGDDILGFVIQGHSDNKPIGTFKPDEQSKLISCSNPGDTLTHKKLKQPIKSLKIKWQAPRGFQGPVTFQATVVKDGATFWVGKIKKDISVA